VATKVLNPKRFRTARPHHEASSRDSIHVVQFSPQQILVSNLKGLSDLHGLRFGPTLLPSPVARQFALAPRNEHLGAQNHFF
jgi:hypothetical protein